MHNVHAFELNEPASDRAARIVPIAGYGVLDAPVEVVVDRLALLVRDRRRMRIAFFNTNLFMKLRKGPPGRFADFLFFNDGMATSAGAVLTTGRGFSNNLNGTDLTPLLLSRLDPGTRVFLYGARPAVVEAAAARIGWFARVEVVGTLDGYSARGAEAAAVIAAARPDVVLVALGNPLQELWIAEHGDATGAPLIMGVGALFDFLAGRMPRAPRWMRRVRLEWLFRLALEPRRLLRRYSLDMLHFFASIWKRRHARMSEGTAHFVLVDTSFPAVVPLGDA